MDFSDLFNNPEDSDLLLRFAQDQTVEVEDEGQSITELRPNNIIESTATDLAVQSSFSRKRGRSDDDGAADAVDPPLSCTLHLHRVILLRSEYFKALVKRWRPAASAQSDEPSSMSAPMLELVERVPEGQLDAAELAIKCMYVGAVPAEAAGNAVLLLHAYQLSDRFQIPASCMDKIAAALSALRAETLTLDILQASAVLPELTGKVSIVLHSHWANYCIGHPFPNSDTVPVGIPVPCTVPVMDITDK